MRRGALFAPALTFLISGVADAASPPGHSATASLGTWKARLTHTLSGPHGMGYAKQRRTRLAASGYCR